MASDDIQKIKDRLSISDVVGEYVQLKRAGRNFNARCPFHSERTASFMVSPERGTYMCFGCGEKGDIFSFVQKIDGLDFPTTLKLLAGKAGVTLSRQAAPNPEKKQREERLLEACEEAVKYFEGELGKRVDVQEYLRSRGVKEETAEAWRLGYAPAGWDGLSKHFTEKGFSKEDAADSGFAVKSEKRPGEVFDRFRGRIMFPIFDAAGRPIAVSGRFFEKVPGGRDDGEPAKYVNSPETLLFRKSRVLYGYDKAKTHIRKIDCILLVEGQFDLIMSHQSGLPYAVALSGTALTPEHLSLLGRLSKRLVLALDADAAGIRSGLKSAEMALAAGFDVKVPAFPPGQDPADVARENPELLKAAIRTSKTAVEFFMDALRPQAKDERAYKKLIEAQVLPLIAAMQSRIDQAHFISLVARRLSVPESAVAAEVARRPAQSGTVQEEAPVSALVQDDGSSLERTAAMLLFRFESDAAMQARLEALLGSERRAGIVEKLAIHADRLKFQFDAEVVEDMDESKVAEDMFASIQGRLMDEEIAAAHQGDPKALMDLVRRREALRK